MRGDVHRLNFAGSGHEQQGVRYAVVVQDTEFSGLSTTLVCPTSTRARPGLLHPTVAWDVERTPAQVMVEQLTAVDSSHLDEAVGYLTHDEMESISTALRLLLDL